MSKKSKLPLVLRENAYGTTVETEDKKVHLSAETSQDDLMWVFGLDGMKNYFKGFEEAKNENSNEGTGEENTGSQEGDQGAGE